MRAAGPCISKAAAAVKVLLLGGYGVFGARLAKLLVIDGHDVCIAGRSLRAAQTCAADLGCRAIQMDRSLDLGALTAHDVVIDAAGPFHTYGDDPYRLARAAIAAGVHYLDLADDAGFCAGIAALDTDARAAGVCVLSGLSSVPALSSAAVRALAGGEVPSVIDTAILPGNRAPRGLSVMQSILSQAGRPMPLWRGHQWERGFGWSRPANYTLPGGLVRQGWQIAVPDQRLFPAHFGAETVRFRAGLELGVMRYGLALFAGLRRLWPFAVTRPLVQVFKGLAGALSPFGSGRGGMSVSVTTPHAHRSWSLIAEDGDGPYIPAIPARALLRRSSLPIGAGPALEAITLAEAEAAMSDLAVTTKREEVPTTFMLERVLGPEFNALPDLLKAIHQTVGVSRWQGRCVVLRGGGFWPRLLCAVFRFPPAQPDVAVAVTKTVTPHGETWERQFGQHRFKSHLSVKSGKLLEAFWPFSFVIGLQLRGGALHYPVTAGRIGPIPLPRWLLPTSEAREFVSGGVFHFDVALLAPITKGLMVRYSGSLIAKERGDPLSPPDDLL